MQTTQQKARQGNSHIHYFAKAFAEVSKKERIYKSYKDLKYYLSKYVEKMSLQSSAQATGDEGDMDIDFDTFRNFYIENELEKKKFQKETGISLEESNAILKEKNVKNLKWYFNVQEAKSAQRNLKKDLISDLDMEPVQDKLNEARLRVLGLKNVDKKENLKPRILTAKTRTYRKQNMFMTHASLTPKALMKTR